MNHEPTLHSTTKQASSSLRHTLVVTPTYNEAQNIERLIREVLAQGENFDILVVDDNSPDKTGDIVAALAAQTNRVQLLRRPGKLGLGTAYIDGFRYALKTGYDFIFQMDADFSHQPKYLPAMLSVAELSTDVVLGSRNVPGGTVENWSRLRELISKGGSTYARLVLGIPIMDLTGGFKCFRARALQKIDLESVRSNGYGFQVEMNYRCYRAGLRMCELPITFPDRVAGKSKMSVNIITEAAYLVLKMRFGELFSHNMRPSIASAPSVNGMTE